MFSNTKGVIWFVADWDENLFSKPNQNKPEQRQRVAFAR